MRQEFQRFHSRRLRHKLLCQLSSEPTADKAIEPIVLDILERNFDSRLRNLLNPAIVLNSDKMHLVRSSVDVPLLRSRVMWVNVLWNIATSNFYIHTRDSESVRAENLLLASSFPLTLSPLNPAPL